LNKFGVEYVQFFVKKFLYLVDINNRGLTFMKH